MTAPRISDRPLDWAFNQDVGSSVGKMILCIICRLGNKTRRCFASIPKIAAAANCQEASVRKWLKAFLARGWLEERGASLRSTRTFVITFGGSETDAGPPAKTSGAPVENITQNPLNLESKPCRRSPERRRHDLIVPPDATVEQILKLYGARRREGG